MTETLRDPPDPVADLTESQRNRLFSSQRRARAVEVLADRGPPVNLEDLAAAVGALETGQDPAPEETVDTVSIALHHAHLPLLDDMGDVDYDPDRNRVEAASAHGSS